MLEPAPDRLSLRGKLGFTMGEYASNLYWQSVSLFLLFFYTDAVGLPAATAGLIYMIASIFDGATDPLMGMIADRTRTRWGRYRPYLLFGAVPLGLSFVLLYYRPPLEGLALAGWMLIAHMVFRLAYTAVSIPYTSLNARVTESSGERSTLAGFRMIFATLAGLTVAALTQPVVDLADGGRGPAHGFMVAAAIFAVVATVVYPLVFLTVREPPERDVGPPLSLREQWTAVLGNRAFWIVMAGISMGLICSAVLGKSVLYYFKYYLNDPAAAKVVLPLLAGVGLVIIPAWIVVSRRVGKRAAWLITTCWNLAGLLFFALVDIRSAPLMMAFLVCMQVGGLGAAMTFWSMLPDTVEYGEWRTGLRAEAFIFGLAQFFLKAALGLGAGLFGWALGAVGYVPNQPQTPETLAGLKTIMVVLPMIGVAGAGLAMWFYPLRRGDHEAIVRVLQARPAIGEEIYET